MDTNQNSDKQVEATIDSWKRKLLDMTKRNNALNFKTTKVSSVTIVDEHPAEVFKRLFLEEKGMRFKAATEEETSVPAEPGDSSR